MADQVTNEVIDETGPVPVVVPELQQRRERIAKTEMAPSPNEESKTDNSGPVPVNVDPLQQDREQVADAGLAHASMRNGNVAATVGDSEAPGETPATTPAAGHRTKVANKPRSRSRSKTAGKSKSGKKGGNVRSAESGQFVSGDQAKKSPSTTVTEN